MSTAPYFNEEYIIPSDLPSVQNPLDLLFKLSKGRDPIAKRLFPKGIPLLQEDEGPDMGESYLHTLTCAILHYGLRFHFADDMTHRVFENLNLYYSDSDPLAYASPDVMVVKPFQPLPVSIPPYRIGRDGPAPLLTAEIMSARTFQQGDLITKPELYRGLRIPEYLLVDLTGTLLPEKLILLQLQANGFWNEVRDHDGGVTSQLGFRLVIDPDGGLRVVDQRSGKRYARPEEAQAAVDALAIAAEKQHTAEERIRALQAELARLRISAPKSNGSGPNA